ncbi:unnamed protein product, partial [marine sediment metagenome]
MKEINRRGFLGMGAGTTGTLLSTRMSHCETVKNTKILT